MTPHWTQKCSGFIILLLPVRLPQHLENFVSSSCCKLSLLSLCLCLLLSFLTCGSHEEERTVYKIFLSQLEGYYLEKVGLEGKIRTKCEDWDCINVEWVKGQWLAIMNKIMKFKVPQKATNLLTKWATVNFSKGAEFVKVVLSLESPPFSFIFFCPFLSFFLSFSLFPEKGMPQIEPVYMFLLLVRLIVDMQCYLWTNIVVYRQTILKRYTL